MNNKLKKHIEQLWNHNFSNATPEEAEASWNRFAEKAFTEKRHKTISLQTHWKQIVAVAAIVIVIVSLPFITTSNSDFLLVENTSSRVEKITLPDNSIVSLQPNTKLYYAKSFQENRSVKLEGEAYFEVAKSKTSLFTVRCNNTTTTVLGTEFSVKSLFNEGAEVALYEGSVKMNIENNTKDWILIPGDLFIYHKEKPKVVAFDKTTDPAQQYIDFDNVRLQEIANHIEKNYGYSFIADTTILSEHITIRVQKDEPLNTIIKTIETIYDLNSQTDTLNKKIILVQKNE